MIACYSGRAHKPNTPVTEVLLAEVGTVGAALVFPDRIETWRNGRMIGKARSIDDALRQAINAENRELKRRK